MTDEAGHPPEQTPAATALRLMTAATDAMGGLTPPLAAAESRLVAMRKLLDAATDDVRQAIEAGTVSAHAVSAAKHSARRLIGIPVVAAAVGVGLALAGVAANPAGHKKGAEPVAVQPTADTAAQSLADANAAHKGGLFDLAAKHYSLAKDAGADPATCLSGLAECQYRLRLDAATLKTCRTLSGLPGGAAGGRYIEGLVYKRQGRFQAAREAFTAAMREGHTIAPMQLTDIAGK